MNGTRDSGQGTRAPSLEFRVPRPESRPVESRHPQHFPLDSVEIAEGVGRQVARRGAVADAGLGAVDPRTRSAVAHDLDFRDGQRLVALDQNDVAFSEALIEQLLE